ncbi:MAG: alpha-galactosidase [Mucilaginibacter sp.]
MILSIALKNKLYRSIFILCFVLLTSVFAVAQNAKITTWNTNNNALTKTDWLIKPVNVKAGIFYSANQRDIILYNGLVKRIFRIKPNVTCIDYQNMSSGQQLLRDIQPEAQLTINGKTYNVGGLDGQKEKAYLKPEWLDTFRAGDNDFICTDHTTSTLVPFINWKPGSWWASATANATGQVLTFTYKNNNPELQGITVKVNYALYDGLPLIAKWLTVENTGHAPIKLDRVKNEILGMVEEESAVVGNVTKMKVQHGLYVETNYAFNNAMRYDISDQTTHWNVEKSYTSQVNYDLTTPCLLEVYPEKAPGIALQPGETFTSVRTNELLMDTYDRERRGMAIRKMYRAIAPWTTENPIFMHLVSRNDAQVRSAIDQCAATGYEAVILSFGSHLNMEDSTAANLKRWKELADYAHSKHIRIGGYSLFSSRKISDDDDVISPVTGKPGGAFFGNAPCFGSKWGLGYRDKIKQFFAQTGFDIWENDGPYPGDVCASTTHPGHKGLDDSQWRQMEIQKELYHWLNARSVYINAPDWYFLDGTNKIAIGYRERDFSLPRDDQKIINRQNIFDGTWEKTPSMGWGFVPLTAYQGGGPEAVLEPLSTHLKDYEQLMMQYYGAGVQACYRGPRLYDTEVTKQTVIHVISWYKKYRDILNSDIIHLRRADGRDWDAILHVNPQLKTKGLLMVYNPLKETLTRKIKVPLYYTGLNNLVKIREREGSFVEKRLDQNHEIELTINIKPEGYTWYVIE